MSCIFLWVHLNSQPCHRKSSEGLDMISFTCGPEHLFHSCSHCFLHWVMTFGATVHVLLQLPVSRGRHLIWRSLRKGRLSAGGSSKAVQGCWIYTVKWKLVGFLFPLFNIYAKPYRAYCWYTIPKNIIWCVVINSDLAFIIFLEEDHSAVLERKINP